MQNEEALAPGGLVAEKYRLLAICGAGSMGSVWSAEHVELGHEVAIKFLHRWLEGTRGGRERFEREAKIAATLGERSAQFPRVMDFARLDDGTAYIVMELLRGESLEARLHRSTLPLAEAVEITRQLCTALQLAHDSGIVHRDLKPANVFLCRGQDGGVLVKVLDFGVARASMQGAYVTTQQGLLLGSPNYMSPERMIEGAVVDSRADLWAVAVMVYFMMVGRLPFGRHENVQDLCIAILQGEPDPPSGLVPELPAAFDDWVRRALAKNIADRFPSAHAMTESLAAITAAGAPASSARIDAAMLPSSAPTLDESSQVPRLPGRRPRGVVLAAGVVVVVVAGVSLAVQMHRPPALTELPSSTATPMVADPARASPPVAIVTSPAAAPAPAAPPSSAIAGAGQGALASSVSPPPLGASTPPASSRVPGVRDRPTASGPSVVRKAAAQWKKGDEM
jgi:eukaryotic-like serine/threonine-protein kinase